MADDSIHPDRLKQIEAAARRADVPNPDLYDTSMIEGRASGNYWTLGVVITFCILLAALLITIAFLMHVV